MIANSKVVHKIDMRLVIFDASCYEIRAGNAAGVPAAFKHEVGKNMSRFFKSCINANASQIASNAVEVTYPGWGTIVVIVTGIIEHGPKIKLHVTIGPSDQRRA